MPEVLALRHVPFEDLDLLEGILERRGHRVRYVEAPTASLAGEVDPREPGLLVILGGPISAFEDEAYPFLAEEAELIRRRLEARLPCLGICLGAQLMARALGAAVRDGAAKELGWAPVSLTGAGRRSSLRHLEGGGTAVLHWHGDTFDLPEGAERLAFTEACPNQAFRWGPEGLALQFHAEAVGASLERWFVGNARDIADTPGVTVSGLRADTARWSPVLAPRAESVFGEWLEQVGL